MIAAGLESGIPCYYRGRPDGGRGERGIFIIICDHGEHESIVFRPGRKSIPPKEPYNCCPEGCELVQMIDMTARPELY